MSSGSQAQLVSAFLGGVAGVGVSLGALFLSAACCWGAIVPEDSLLGQVLRVICMPGAAVARGVDRSGGWLSLWTYFAVSFAIWAVLVWVVRLAAVRVIAPRPHA